MKMHEPATKEKSPVLNESKKRTGVVQCKGYEARVSYLQQPVQLTKTNELNNITHLKSEKHGYSHEVKNTGNMGLDYSNGDAYKVSALPMQFKLIIGQPYDKYEREADLVAKQVVQVNKKPDFQQTPEAPDIQPYRMQEHENKLQMEPMFQPDENEGSLTNTSELETSINRLKGSGKALHPGIRQPMELAFNASFNRVKIHTSSESDKLNKLIQAKAFTTGHDIFFRQGAYEPTSQKGKELIAHELTHVIQQNNRVVPPRLQLSRKIHQNMGYWNQPTLQRILPGRKIKTIHSSPDNVIMRGIMDQNKKIKHPGKTKNYKQLSAKQKATYLGMHNNPFRTYQFPKDKLSAYFTSASKIIKRLPLFKRRQRPSKALGAIPSSDDFFESAYTEKGASRYFDKTGQHHSNWVEYVKIQFAAIKEQLGVSKKPYPVLLQNNRTRAIELASDLDVLPFQGDMGTFALAEASGVLKNPTELNNLIESSWAHVSTLAKLPLQYPKPLIPEWGNVLSEDRGNYVKATFQPNSSWPAGSETDTVNFYSAWWKKASQRKEIDRSQTIYVQGHLLNNHIGGPAASYNLVPLLDGVNKAHEGLVESTVKNYIIVMHNEESARKPGDENSRDWIKQIFYSVKALYEQHKDKRESAAKDIENQKDNLDALLKKDNTLKKLRINDSNTFQMLQNAGASHGIKIDGKLLQCFDAVVGLNENPAPTLVEAYKLLQDNYELWIWENKNVPTGLQYTVIVTKEISGEQIIAKDQVLNNSLPIDLAQPFKRNQ